MTDFDINEARMIQGQAAMQAMDALDTQLVEAMSEVADAVEECATIMRGKGMGQEFIASYIMGALATLILRLPEDED